jgi:DNA polymerase II large subunit
MEIPNADPITKKYFETLKEKSDEIYAIANTARAKGLDVETKVEVSQAANMADRTETLVGLKGVSARFSELAKTENNRDNIMLKIFKEIIEGKLGEFNSDQKRVEIAIKTALTLITEGMVVSPQDGLPKILISKNADGTQYIDLYYAGPIRAAGATATVLPMILADYAQKLLNLDTYKPTKEEIERYVEENKIYHSITTRQYKPSDDDIRYIIQNCPVCINGIGTELEEVETYKDLKRVATNKVRGGACLVISEGIGLKYGKLITYAKKVNLDWSWLNKFVKVKDKGDGKKEILPSKTFLEGCAAGRPIFGFPSKFGAFRVRIGRTRTTGIMGKAIHPVTMYLLGEFPAVGSQFKVERPAKSATITACDDVEPPIVQLKNGSVIRLEKIEQFQDLKDEVEKILFLGDMLIPFGDFRKSGHPLVPLGFCEEWWHKILLKKSNENEKLKKILENLDYKNVDEKTAIEITKEFNVPLHPKYTYYYKNLTILDLKYLIEKFNSCEKEYENEKLKKLVFDFDDQLSYTFKNILLPFEKKEDKIIINESVNALLETFKNKKIDENDSREILNIISEIAEMKIKDKSGNFIGARLGRPEAAKARKMKGSPHALFPISKLGGNTRSINKAIKTENEEILFGSEKFNIINIGMFECPKCKENLSYPYCFKCKIRTEQLVSCRTCKKTYNKSLEYDFCPSCKGPLNKFTQPNFDINKIFEEAIKRLNITPPELVKGVEELISPDKISEPIEKGILRAKNDVYVFKDGTIRMDLIDINLSHFKPKEIDLSIEEAKELGYTEDVLGNPLEDENQIVRMLPQDVVINEDVADYAVKITQFIDELLVKFYKIQPFYNITTKEELRGHLILGLAPHTSAAALGRIIGTTKVKGLFAHPYFHNAKRRNTDGDEDGIIMLMDALLNFSIRYLPYHKNGGKMDAPLIATIFLNPDEIDDEAHEIECGFSLPLKLYEAAEKTDDPFLKEIDIVANHLGKDTQYSCVGFTHNISQYDLGPKQSMYTRTKDMEEKITLQANLQKKIKAVDYKASLELVLNAHLIPDLIGNARSFSRQKFRCTKCKTKYRRLPLVGKCLNCGNNLILSIAQGSVKKYLELIKKLILENDLSEYMKQRIVLAEKEVNSIFSKEKKNKDIMNYF